jgi:hypothetical protein
MSDRGKGIQLPFTPSMNGDRGDSILSILLAIFAALTGMTLAVWSTRLGPGVGGDATIYMVSAQNLVKGIGLGLVQPDGSFRLLPYSAPLFPLVLSPFAAANLDLTTVARWLNILLFGGIILLVGLTSLKAINNKWVAALPAWLTACSPVLLPVYSWAMAEPLTMLLGFGGLVQAWANLDEEPSNRIGWLDLSGLLFGLSMAARYSAAAFLAVGLLVCLLWLKFPFKKRILAAFRMGLVGVIPLAAWIIVQLGQTASVSSRSILTLAEMRERFMLFWPQLNSAILVWALPASFQDTPPYPAWINTILPLAILCALGALSFWIMKKDDGRSFQRIITILWIFSGIYTGILLLVYLTTYPPITIDNRMLSPVHMAVIWIAGMLLAAVFTSIKPKIGRFGLALVLLGVVAWYGIRTVRIVQQNAETGLGYNSVTWRDSKVIAALKAIPESQPLVTNETMAILYLTGRIASPVVEIYYDEPVTSFTRYGDGPEGKDPAEAEFKAANSLLVVFNTLENQLQPIYGERSKERADALVKGLRVVAFGDDGAIYYYPVDYSGKVQP